jgi:hypothetical protein
VSYRPLAFVAGLTFADYVLWNWSLNAGHDLLALVSGLTLPALALASAWTLALTLIRMLGSSTRGSNRAGSARRSAIARRADGGRERRRGGEPTTSPSTSGALDRPPAGASSSPSSPGKLAA